MPIKACYGSHETKFGNTYVVQYNVEAPQADADHGTDSYSY